MHLAGVGYLVLLYLQAPKSIAPGVKSNAAVNATVEPWRTVYCLTAAVDFSECQGPAGRESSQLDIGAAAAGAASC